MADEGRGRRRRRGRRRDRKDANNRPEDGASKDDLSRGDFSGEDIASESEVPDVVDDQPETADEEPKDASKTSQRERTHVARSGGEVSPMDFWRSGRMRSARERRAGTGPSEPQGFFKRITSVPLPPWVPVVAIIFVVFGVLGLLFVVRSATGAPRIGVDHWHANYTYYVCGEKQPPSPIFSGVGVHTHGGGIIHIHPFQQSEEGAGARLSKWFGYGGGELSGDKVRMPGSADTHKNGDECPDGTIGEVQVFANGVKIHDYTRYLPKDGDRVRIVFGEAEEQVQLDDRIVIPEEDATREIEITVDQPGEAETSTIFTPSTISVDAGEVVKLVLQNVDEVSHGLRAAGVDGLYGTSDDFVVVPEGSDPENPDQGDIIAPGGFGSVIIRFIEGADSIEFRDPTVITTTGTIVVSETVATETPAPAEDFEVELDVDLLDGVYEPDVLLIDVRTRVKLNLNNLDKFVHNLRIAGPDGEYETEDDIVSEDILPGETGELIFELDVEGPYIFRDDFRAETMTGDLIVQ